MSGDSDTLRENDEEGHSVRNEERQEKVTANYASFKELFFFAKTKTCKVYLIVGALFALISGLLYPFMIIYLTRVLRDLVASTTSDDFMRSIEKQVYSLLVIGSVSLVTMSLQDTLLVRGATEMSFNLHNRWFDALIYQNMSYHDSHNMVGESCLISSNVSKYKRGVGRKLGLGIQYTTTAIGSFLVAFTFSWKVSLVLLSAMPFMGINAYLIARVTTVQGTKSAESYARAGNIVYMTATAIRTVLSLNACQIMISKFENATSFMLQTERKSLPWVGIGQGSLFTFMTVMYTVFTLFGPYVMYNEIRKSGCDPTDTVPGVDTCPVTSADVFGTLFGIFIGCAGIPQISVSFEALNHARLACYPAIKLIKRHSNNKKCDTEIFIDEENVTNPHVNDGQEPSNNVASHKVINADSNQGLKPNSCVGELEFNKVSFSYPTRAESQILKGLSIKIEAGKLVALVGPSGCGKSTLMQLIERFYDPTAGSIKLDGIDLRDINVKWLRNNIGLVSQEPVLFARTIKENIEYGCHGSTQEDIESVAKSANAHDFIMSFPKGYSTIVGDRGVLLSGGQKQRIAIARALLKKPKILLLDEATSALDTENELEVQRAIDVLIESKERTTIVIAHRLSTICHADVIAVMKDKNISETGTHSDLMSRTSSSYKEMIESQFKIGESKTTEQIPSIDDVELCDKNQEITNEVSLAPGLRTDFNDQLVFRDISFAYPSRPERTVLHGLNLTIHRGETIGIVGPSGSGKSSLINLIERFYDPQEGSIYLDGIKIHDMNVDWLRRQLALVAQEPTLFNDTIRNNISYGCPEATQDEIEKASKQANAHNFITSFPSGYETDVGQIGSNLSGGQKQRIAIARAILRKPKILLLDEATSALDTKSESLVEETLERLMADSSLTKIIVAHRFSTIRNANRIVVIKDGSINEIGTHDELMSQENSYYKYMHGLQTIKDGPRPEYEENRAGKSELEERSKEVAQISENEESGDSALVDKNDVHRARLLAKEDSVYLLTGILGALMAGAIFPANGFLFAYTIDLVFKPTSLCDDSIQNIFGSCADYYKFKADDMQNLSFNITYAWVGTGVVTFFGYILLYFGFGYAAARMNKRIRDSAFRSLIRQEVSYFDNQIVGNIASRIEEDAAMIHSFSGEPLRTFFVNISSVVVGVIVCFVFMWPFALLSLGILPFMAFGAEMEMKSFMVEEISDNVLEDETSPGGIATEAMSNIRTVASLSIESEMSQQYMDSVRRTTVTDFYTLFKMGAATGLGFFVQTWGMALMFWFGGWLLQKYPDSWTFRDYNIAMFTLFFSLYGASEASHGATSSAQAKEAAKRIFSLIDKESKIDSLSKDGIIS